MTAKKTYPVVPIVDQFRRLKKSLRELDIQWVSKLAQRIQTNKEIDKAFRDEITDRKIYNVFNGIVKDGKWKVLIYNEANSYLEELRKSLSAN